MNFSRNAVLWLVIILLIFALFNLFQGTSATLQQPPLRYTDFLDRVESGEVNEITLQGQEITGKFRDGTAFKTMAPENTDVFAAMRENGVQVEVAPPEETNALVQILTEPKNALTRQYEKLFHMEGCEIEFREDALRAVARKAMERKTGARGLRTILEQVLLDTMYDLPSLENVRKVLIDENVIVGDAKPYMIFDTPGAIAASE